MKLVNKVKMTQVLHTFSAMFLTLLNAQVVLAAPTGGNVVKGDATIQQTSPSRTDINQSSDKAIINWDNFSVKQGESVNFNQPSRSSVTLNRVTGGSISDIQGALNANGNVFLINPNGIVFGRGSVVDVAGLVASTANINDNDFMAGRFAFSGAGNGSIVNEGTITVEEGGLVALVAPSVRNNGMIQARLGRVALVSGDAFTVDLYGDGLVNLAVNGESAQSIVANSGSISADGGKVLISAQAAKNIVDNVINMDGVVQARSVAGNNGTITLSGGTVSVAGQLDASGVAQTGGNIDVLGQSIRVAGNVDASGSSGGQIHIGGDYQGKGSRQRASETVIVSGSVIQANASSKGDGGRVIVWSDNETSVDGQINARGGFESGDGGFVETSSAGKLGFTTSVDVKAAGKGKAGTWLIDPENITINSAFASTIEDSLNGGSSVIVQTAESGNGEGNLTVAAPITKTAGGDASLSLLAHNDLNVNAPITSTSGELDVNLRAGSAINVNSSINTNGGGLSASKWNVPTNALQIASEGNKPAEENDVTSTTDSVIDVPASSTVAVEGSMVNQEPNKVEPVTSSQPIITKPILTAKVQVSQSPTTVEAEAPVSTEIVAIQTMELTPKPINNPSEKSAPRPALSSEKTQTVSQKATSIVSNVVTGTTDSIDITVAESAVIETQGGDILLISGENGEVEVNGSLDSSSVNGKGGDIALSGNAVMLSATATLDSSGVGASATAAGGGNIVVGVDTAGNVAQTVTVAQGAAINANANTQGTGGNVYIQAQQQLAFGGDLNAQGAGEGKGGNVTLSSQGDLDYTGNINVQSNNTDTHNGGTVFLQAESLTVVNEQNLADSVNQLGMDQLAALGDVDLQVKTEGDLTFNELDGTHSLEQNKSQISDGFGGFTTIGVRTAAFVSEEGDINSSADSVLSANSGNIVFDAQKGSVTTGGITTQSGSITIQAQDDITVGVVATLGGSLTAESQEGDFRSTGKIDLVSSESVERFSPDSGEFVTELNHESGSLSVKANSILLNSGLDADVLAADVAFTVDVSGKVDANVEFPEIGDHFAGSSPSTSLTLAINDKENNDQQLYFNKVEYDYDDNRPSQQEDRIDEFLSEEPQGEVPELVYESIISDFNLNINDELKQGDSNGDSVTINAPLDDTDFSNETPSVAPPPSVVGEVIEPPVTPKPPVMDPVTPPVTDPEPPTTPPVTDPEPPTIPPVLDPTPPPVIDQPSVIQPIVPESSPVVENVAGDSSSQIDQTRALVANSKNNPEKEPAKTQYHDCANRDRLAWLQSGIRSAAEVADMGRGDGTDADDVFKRCY